MHIPYTFHAHAMRMPCTCRAHAMHMPSFHLHKVEAVDCAAPLSVGVDEGDGAVRHVKGQSG